MSFAQHLQVTSALLQGWQEFTDRTSGQVYYGNPATGKTQWERPTIYVQHLQLVLDPALPLPLHIDLGEYSRSWANGKLKLGQFQEGFRELSRDELMQLMRRLQASPHVILLNLSNHACGADTMREMAAPIAALSELQALVLTGTSPPPDATAAPPSPSLTHCR